MERLEKSLPAPVPRSARCRLVSLDLVVESSCCKFVNFLNFFFLPTLWIRSSGSKAGHVWAPEGSTAFKCLISARFCAALLSNISDCDETFNYWEPVSPFLPLGLRISTCSVQKPIYLGPCALCFNFQSACANEHLFRTSVPMRFFLLWGSEVGGWKTLCSVCCTLIYLFALCFRHTTSFMGRGFRHGSTLQPTPSVPMLTCGCMPCQPGSMPGFCKPTR